jgi:hypothetical protein
MDFIFKEIMDTLMTEDFYKWMTKRKEINNKCIFKKEYKEYKN